MLQGIVGGHQWFWDGNEHVDPAKEAKAQSTRLSSRTTSLAREYAKQGLDWDSELRQIAKERKLMHTLGIAPADAVPTNTKDMANDPSK